VYLMSIDANRDPFCMREHNVFMESGLVVVYLMSVCMQCHAMQCNAMGVVPCLWY
jgi:hypothetical protein